MLRKAELILVMEKSHIDALPIEVRGRAKLLGQWSGGEISDPYCKSPEFFAEIFLNIERGVEAWSYKLWK
jgi:protein-tyrosine-phosphatase